MDNKDNDWSGGGNQGEAVKEEIVNKILDSVNEEEEKPPAHQGGIDKGDLEEEESETTETYTDSEEMRKLVERDIAAKTSPKDSSDTETDIREIEAVEETKEEIKEPSPTVDATGDDTTEKTSQDNDLAVPETTRGAADTEQVQEDDEQEGVTEAPSHSSPDNTHPESQEARSTVSRRSRESVPGALIVEGIDEDESTTQPTEETTLSARLVDKEEEKRVIREEILRDSAFAQVIGRDGDISAGNDVDENLNKKWRLCLAGSVILTLMVIAAVLGVVFGVILPRRDESTDETPRFVQPPSQSTPEFQDLFNLLASVSSDGGEALSYNSTPQNQALYWLANNTNLHLYTNTTKIQRYALAVFYLSTEGDGWDRNDFWLDNGDECGRWWQQGSLRLSCSNSGAVTHLELYDNALMGTLPPEIGLLSESLESLSLCCNDVVGTIPDDIGKLTKLKILDLSFNDLSGDAPSAIYSLTNLETLLLEGNANLYSECPYYIENCTAGNKPYPTDEPTSDGSCIPKGILLLLVTIVMSLSLVA